MITITAENYYRIYNQIKRFSLPDHIQKGAKFIDKVTNYGRNWKAYFDPYSSTYRDFANNYFAQLSKFIDEELKKSVVYERLQKHDSHSETGTRQRTNGSTRTRRKVRKSVSKPQKPPVQKAERPTLRKPSEVSKLDEAVYIIKRYYNMHNDRKTYQQILNFTNDLQLALMEKRITKTTPYAKEVMSIQENLLHLLDNISQTGKTLITFPVQTLNHFRNIVEGQRQLHSVKFIKSYMTLQGKIISNKTAINLYNRILEAKISETDPYRSEIDKILNNLRVFTKKNHYQGLLTIPKRDLSGLMGISHVKTKKAVQNKDTSRTPRGRKPNHGLSGFDGELTEDELQLLYGSPIAEEQTEPKIYKASDIVNMKFDVLPFTGKWEQFFGRPSRGFCFMVSGKPKFGKSTFCLEFADYLAKDFGKVLYIVREEGIGDTLKRKLEKLESIHPNFECADRLVNDYSKWDFVFFDSVTKLGLTPEHIERIRKQNPKICFIEIMQVTKQGVFRGSNSFQHDVDSVVEIFDIGCARQIGRFNPYAEMEFLDPDGEF